MEALTMTQYEAREIAYHLIDGGWSGNDEEFFREENAKQETPLTDDEITMVFNEMRKIEALD
jgi:hypothetical protein